MISGTMIGFAYYFKEWQGKLFLCIEDTPGNNGKSLTNSIEDVVENIDNAEDVDVNECLIIYRDSDDVWDGWDNVNNTFIYLGCSTAEQAMKKYYEKLVLINQVKN